MKFSVGEVVIASIRNSYAVSKYGFESECTILKAGPFNAGYYDDDVGKTTDGSDYVIQLPDGDCWFAPESLLQKRPQPPQYKDQFTPCELGYDKLMENIKQRKVSV